MNRQILDQKQSSSKYLLLSGYYCILFISLKENTFDQFYIIFRLVLVRRILYFMSFCMILHTDFGKALQIFMQCSVRNKLLTSSSSFSDAYS